MERKRTLRNQDIIRKQVEGPQLAIGVFIEVVKNPTLRTMYFWCMRGFQLCSLREKLNLLMYDPCLLNQSLSNQYS